MSMPDAVAAFVPDGATIALEGFTHLIPFAPVTSSSASADGT